MGRKWWDEKRREAYAKEDKKCHCCGIHQNRAKFRQLLEAHESYKIDWAAGRAELVEIVALCHSCHNYIHRRRMQALVQCGRMNMSKAEAITKHGQDIVAALVKQLEDEADRATADLYLEYFAPHVPDQWAPWTHWVLLIDGTEYPGRFRSEDEWGSYYNWLNISGNKDSKKMLESFRNGKN